MRLRPNSVSPQCAPTTSISRPGERLMCANVYAKAAGLRATCAPPHRALARCSRCHDELCFSLSISERSGEATTRATRCPQSEAPQAVSTAARNGQ
jgi:hypothetical protein